MVTSRAHNTSRAGGKEAGGKEAGGKEGSNKWGAHPGKNAFPDSKWGAHPGEAAFLDHKWITLVTWRLAHLPTETSLGITACKAGGSL